MTTDITILLITAVSIGFVHTLTGPDHYLPFIVMSKALNWSFSKTMWITFMCGSGHVLGSVLLGAFGIALGIGVQKLEFVEAFRGNLAAHAFILFGLLYFLWGLWRVVKGRQHKHLQFRNGKLSVHTHKSDEKNMDTEDKTAEKKNITPWVLFTIFVLGPCEPLIPLLIYPAAKSHMGYAALVALVFGVATLATMMVMVAVTLRGMQFLPMKTLEKYMHPVAGATICLSGCAIVFLGL